MTDDLKSREIAPVPPTNEDGLPSVAGRVMTKPIYELERALIVLIGEEQEKLGPENHLIGTMCEAVRLCREYGDSYKTQLRALASDPVPLPPDPMTYPDVDERVPVVALPPEMEERIAEIVTDWKQTGIGVIGRPNLDYLLSTIRTLQTKPKWTCFHCGFETSDDKQAAAHFGDRDDAEEFKPLCRWWYGMTPEERGDALQEVIQQLNDANSEASMQFAELSQLRTALNAREVKL